MATPLATYKYKHGLPRGWRTPGLVVAALVFLGFCWACTLHPAPAFLALVALGVTLALARGPQVLRVGPRYLLCGPEVVYFGQVARVEVHRHQGTLKLHLPAGRTWVLERERFPTNARKAPKVAANKEKKFHSLVEKLVAKVQKANPGAEIRELA